MKVFIVALLCLLSIACGKYEYTESCLSMTKTYTTSSQSFGDLMKDAKEAEDLGCDVVIVSVGGTGRDTLYVSRQRSIGMVSPHQPWTTCNGVLYLPYEDNLSKMLRHD